jgi:lactose/cellobiose-specific phosphotransferase system IIC component
MHLFSLFTEKINRLDISLERFLFLGSVRNGLTLMIPFLLIGSFALIIISLPVPAYQQFMLTAFGTGWTIPFLTVFKGSFGILSIIMTLSVSYVYAGNIDRGRNSVNPMIASIVSLCSFLILSGMGSSRFDLETLGVTGLFTAIIASTLSSKIFASLCSIRALRIRTYSDGAHTSFNDAIASIFPALITISLFAAAYNTVVFFFGSASIQQFISGHLTSAFKAMGPSLASALLFILLIHLFWSIGIHGNNILEPVALSLFIPALAVNQSLVGKGAAPTEIFTKTFFDTFVFMGGCGSALCLVIAIFIAARRKNMRRHAKLSLFPVLFNVNELIVFGLPIVFNPVYIIPFILTPLILTLTSFAAVSSGLVPHTTHMSEWTTPVLLGGWISTGSIRGSFLQLFNLALGTFCFIPFVRIAEKRSTARMIESLSGLKTAIEQPEHAAPSLLMSRKDRIGNISRSLAVDLENDLRGGRLFLVYHPQVSYEGKLHGIEALLRWDHPIGGNVAPSVIIALAEEAHLEEELAAWILDTSCRDLAVLRSEISTDVILSVNASPRQMDGDVLLETLTAAIRKHSITPSLLKIEITEKDALSGTWKTRQQMHAIKELGVKLAMDDFGMGHSSLMYLKEYDFDTIKIDGSLVKDLLSKPTCGEIISSIVNLGKSLNYSVIAEYVETVQQRDELHNLGCNLYQGYYFSKPLRIEELCVFARILRA